MGRVEGYKNKLMVEGVRSACDARCTGAIGPHCDCICDHKNHGTGRLVHYEKENGTLTVTDKKLLEGNETYLAKIKELAEQKANFRQLILAWMGTRFAEVVASYTNGWYQGNNWKDYRLYRDYKDQMEKIERLKTIKNKVAAYLKLFEQVRVS